MGRRQTIIFKGEYKNMRSKESLGRRFRKKLRHQKRNVRFISLVLILMVGLMVGDGISLCRLNRERQAQEKELLAQIQEETKRAEEIDELEQYVLTQEYVEDIARDKLNYAHDNEIIFRVQQ